MSEKIAKGSLQLLIANIVMALSSYGALAIIARSITVTDFGNYVFVMTLLVWFELFTSEAFMHPITKAIAQKQIEKYEHLLGAHLKLSFVLTAIFLALPYPLASILSDHSLPALMLFAAFDILPFAMFSREIAILNSQHQFRQRANATVIYGLGKFVFMSLIALTTSNVGLIFLGMAMASTAGFAYARNCRKEINFNSANGESRKKTKATYLLSTIIIASTGIVLNADLWILKSLHHSKEFLGHYGAAHNIVKIMYLATISLFYPLLPTISESGNFLKTLKNNNDVFKVTLLILSGLGFGSLLLSLFPELFLSVLFGQKYSDAADILRLLAPSYAFGIAALMMIQIKYHTGHPSFAAVSSVLCAAGFCVLCILYIKLLQPVMICLAPASIAIILFLLLLACRPFSQKETA